MTRGRTGKAREDSGRRRGLFLALLLLNVLPYAAAADYAWESDYRNLWLYRSGTTNQTIGAAWTNYYACGPDASHVSITNASTVVYHGTAGKYTYGTNSPASPAATNVQGGSYRIAFSSFGQPVQSLLPDAYVGDVIDPPGNSGVDTNRPPANFVAVRVGNNPAAFYEEARGAAFYIPSTRQVVAAAAAQTIIVWATPSGGRVTNVVVISGVPQSRPARLFWTEKPYEAPAVDL